MNIFYYSLHHILEYDEVTMLKSMGHNVFRIGTCNRSTSTAQWRPEIPNSAAEDHICDLYEAAGGRYTAARNADEIIPPGFLGHFSVAIIMHAHDFIFEHWQKLKDTRVIWRTIGQAVDLLDEPLKPLRDQGLRIVRYSPRELEIPFSLGQEAIIRFGKAENEYGGWTGHERHVLTFANVYKGRYPQEAAAFRQIAAQVPCVLGGVQNESFEQAIGILDPAEQVAAYRAARVYLYASGLSIPYTLNFMEAWLMGAPVVLYAPLDRIGPYFEIDRLLEDGRTGFVCRSVAEVVRRCRELLDDHELAQRIGQAGRQRAEELFSMRSIAPQWQNLLDRVTSK